MTQAIGLLGHHTPFPHRRPSMAINLAVHKYSRRANWIGVELLSLGEG